MATLIKSSFERFKINKQFTTLIKKKKLELQAKMSEKKKAKSKYF
jgi:hypothetical protein